MINIAMNVNVRLTRNDSNKDTKSDKSEKNMEQERIKSISEKLELKREIVGIRFLVYGF